jgi:hypothetical protein
MFGRDQMVRSGEGSRATGADSAPGSASGSARIVVETDGTRREALPHEESADAATEVSR